MKASLRMILKCNEVLYFDVVQYDLTFTSIKSQLLTYEELYSMCESMPVEDRDFNIDNKLLQCNPILKIVQVDEQTLDAVKECDAMECERIPEYALYSLLQRGIEQKFLILDDKKENWKDNTGVAGFSNIHFSSSTMTVYVRMFDGNNIYNKMIVTMDDNGNLQFKPFLIAVPENTLTVPECKDLNRTVEINNVKYRIWETGDLSLCVGVALADGVINQAQFNSTRYQSAINLCKDFLKDKTDFIGDAPQWGGGTKSYAFNYGVYLKSSATPLDRTARRSILFATEKTITEGIKEPIEIVRYVLDYCTGDRKTASQLLKYVSSISAKITASGDGVERIKAASELLYQLQCIQFYTDMYLYRVRVYSYTRKMSLTKRGVTWLVGGNTKEFTKVNTLFN